MRRSVFAFIAFALVACSPPQAAAPTPSAAASPTTAAAAGCNRTATHNIRWSSETQDDIVTVSSMGPDCGRAVILLVMRAANGDLLWTHAGVYYDISGHSIDTQNEPVTVAQMDEFLTNWGANRDPRRSGSLPDWTEGVATLAEAATDSAAYATSYDRETYQALRQRNLPMFCYENGIESSDCLVMDPMSHSPTVIVNYGA